MNLAGQTPGEGKNLGKISELFDKLVKQQGPLAAARVIVGLLLPVP